MATINKIFWKRTYLFIEYSSDCDVLLCLKNKATGRLVPMEHKQLGPSYYRAKLNVTIANGRDLLEAGSWDIICSNSQDTINFSDCLKSSPYVGQRIFRYTHRFYSYAFRLSNDGATVSIENNYYMSVKDNQEDAFINSFFN